MRAAVADIGTSSSHLLIAEAQAGGYRVLDTLKLRTMLGECLDAAGNLTPEGEDRLAHALTQFAELARGAGVSEVRVYATSALREAPNGSAVAERMLERTGLYPTIISGKREGELTYLGVGQSVELGADNVVLDLGGGSLEFVRGDRLPSEVLSLPLGSIRMTLGYVPDGVGSSKQIEKLRGAVQRALGPHLARFAARSSTDSVQTQFLLSSGTAEAAAEAIAALRGESVANVNGFSFTLSELHDLLERIRKTKPAARAKIAGIERRLGTIVAGLATLHTALEMLGAQRITVSAGALREGMLVEELSRLSAFTQSLSPRQRSVLSSAERYGVNLAHAQQVAELSRQLFDSLAPYTVFPPEARSLLTAAAALHESGQIVAQSSHHKHSAYLIRHAGLAGFSPREIELIAQIARYHRKSPPKPSHSEFMALAGPDQKTVSRLAAILRVADGLDRAHSGSAQIRELSPHKAGWRLRVTGATPLDLAGAAAKADLWQKEFGPLSIEEN